MIATAIILFREVLEASLIIAIVMGATRGVAQRGRWMLGGIALGVFGASIVALLAVYALINISHITWLSVLLLNPAVLA